MAFDPIEYIRTRSREEWQQLALERWTDLRIWIQENGEKAAVAALIAGVLTVLFYRFLVGLFALGIIAIFVGWSIARPASEQPPREIEDKDI